MPFSLRETFLDRYYPHFKEVETEKLSIFPIHQELVSTKIQIWAMLPKQFFPKRRNDDMVPLCGNTA